MMYICDPSKYLTCNKRACYENDGPCYLTKDKEHALKLDGKVLTEDNHVKLFTEWIKKQELKNAMVIFSQN